MSRLSTFFAALGRIVLVAALAVTLLFTTACNNGDLRGARPNNPPVQMGGNNNPYKAGGDGYTNYKASTDPRAKDPSKLRSSVDRLPSGQLIADRDIESNAQHTLLYPGNDAQSSKRPDIGPRGAALKPEPVPADRQEVIDRSDPNQKILEKVGKQFEDASSFVKDSFDTAVDRGISDDQERTRGSY